MRSTADDAVSDHAPLPRRGFRLWRWVARGLLWAALASVMLGWWLRKSGHEFPQNALSPEALRVKPVTIDWAREPFRKWTDPEDGIEVEYPEPYDVVRGFGKFTSREVAGGIREEDLVAFRCAEPRSVIVIAIYRSNVPKTWDEWCALASEEPGAPVKPGAPEPLALKFGTSERQITRVNQNGQPALAISARGAEHYPLRGNERMELWNLESRLLGEGKMAVRITAGVHADQYAGTREGLKRVLDSFRWRLLEPAR